MYKDLKDSIKDFNPTDSDLEIINNRFLDHNFIHSGNNLFGEMYEVWVYEYLKEWAIRCSDVDNFVIKDSKLYKPCNSGLSYDKNGQIIFYLNGKKSAEFDGLFTYKGNIVFVESSVSELRSYYKKLEDRVVKKRDLLVKYFNTDKVYYLVVTRPRKKSLTYRSLPHLVLSVIKNPTFSELTKTDRVINIDDSKFKTLESISFSSFS